MSESVGADRRPRSEATLPSLPRDPDWLATCQRANEIPTDKIAFLAASKEDIFVTVGTRFRASEGRAVEEELLLPFEASSEPIDVSSVAATRRFLAGLALFIIPPNPWQSCSLRESLLSSGEE